MNIKAKLEQFVGIFPNVINDDWCFEFLKWFNKISEQGLTKSSIEVSSLSEIDRKDEVINIPSGLTLDCFPTGMMKSFWQNISECYKIYHNEYSIDQPTTAYEFKVHRVNPTGGYHVWHHEHTPLTPYRILVWHLTIEACEEGGETEFLHQSIRLEPKVGQLVIWPAGFTHKHRGNPPLKGQKTYLTGWFETESKTLI